MRPTLSSVWPLVQLRDELVQELGDNLDLVLSADEQLIPTEADTDQVAVLEDQLFHGVAEVPWAFVFLPL